jgi:alkanesulfonate monooxygenase SsuD/methylene tetrahydromethanopterin reductase-like flavin-dependent oxidoreductase (luciferase family)
MRFGINIPNMGVCGDARMLAELAHDAEGAGWDGLFVWDSLYVKMEDPRNDPTCDPWIALAAMAMRTSRVRLGTMITPVTRRRPWKLARETVTLDQLSNGRLVMPVGLGYADDGAFSKVNEVTDRKARAQRLDEGLAILNGLWSGEAFAFQGEHYQIESMAFQPRPVQQPRIPVWVVGAWARPKSMRRAIQWDGVLPFRMTSEGESLAEDGAALAAGMSPQDVREMKAYIEERRTDPRPYDIVLEGNIPPIQQEAVDMLAPYVEAGATWWLDSLWQDFYTHPGEVEPLRERILKGPPMISG